MKIFKTYEHLHSVAYFHQVNAKEIMMLYQQNNLINKSVKANQNLSIIFISLEK